MHLHDFLSFFFCTTAQGGVEYKTKTLNNTVQPQWNEVYMIDFINYVPILCS